MIGRSTGKSKELLITAFDHKFFLNMYEYLKLKKTKKVDVGVPRGFTSREIMDIINELEEYIHGSDSDHKQLSERTVIWGNQS